MKGGERLSLATGTALALRAIVEHNFRHEITLKAYFAGVACDGVPEANALAERFRREPWTASPVKAHFNFIDFPKLREQKLETHVDALGVIHELEVCACPSTRSRRVYASACMTSPLPTHAPAHPQPHTPTLLPAVAIGAQEPTEFERKSDGALRVKRVLEIVSASQHSVRVTLFQTPDEAGALELARGMVVAVRGIVGLSKGYVALTAFGEGVVRNNSAEARLLAEQFRREQWSPAPLVPDWKFVDFTALPNQPEKARVDALGFVMEHADPVGYTRTTDGSAAQRQTIVLCDEDERCVDVTVFLDADVRLTFRRGAVVGLRAAKISEWQGVRSLSVSAHGVAFDVEDDRTGALRAKAAEMVGHADVEMVDDADVGAHDVAAVRGESGAPARGEDLTEVGVLAPARTASNAPAPAVGAAAAEWQEIQLPDGRRVLLNTRTMQTAPVADDPSPRAAK